MTEDQTKLDAWIWKHAKILPMEEKQYDATWAIVACVLGLAYVAVRMI